MKSEDFLRLQVRRILKEELSWGTDDSYYGGGPELSVFNTLIMPFVDVFQTAFVAFKDITSAALDLADYAITFDPEKQKDIKERYRQRREKYKQQYKEVMKSTDAALSTPDAKLLTFMAAPGYALTKGATKLAWSATEPARDKAEDYFGGALGIGDSAVAASTSADKSPGLMADLKRAFFGESLDEIDRLEEILFEQERSKGGEEPPSEKQLQKMANEYLEDSGQKEEIAKAWDSIIKDKREETAEIIKMQKEKVDLLTKLSVAETVEEAEGHIRDLKSLGLDFSSSFDEIKSALQKEYENLAQNEDAASKLIKSLRKLPEAAKIPEDAGIEAYREIIEKGFLGSAFGSAIEEGKKAGVAQLMGFVAEMTEEELRKLSSLSPKGKEYAEVIFKFRDDLLSL